jgi:outer membrane protein assembly factor BamE (lipoprotein component of BamABCDE complex)
MQRSVRIMMATMLLAALVGCSSHSAQQPAPASTGAVAAPAPAGSTLSHVTIGMTKKQVKDVLGPPTDENSYSTGKVWIPFYFGNDARRTSFYYKGIGRVVFADGNAFGGGASEVVRVDYDPAESGTAR